MFYDYINYDWSNDNDFKAASKLRGAFANKREEEEFRRKYYQQSIDPNFEVFFHLNEDDRERFLEFVRYQTDLISLEDLKMRNQTTISKMLVTAKHLGYLGVLLTLPISMKAAALSYSFAIFWSFILRKWKAMYAQSAGLQENTSFWHNFFVEEETLTFVNFLLMVFAGT